MFQILHRVICNLPAGLVEKSFVGVVVGADHVVSLLVDHYMVELILVEVCLFLICGHLYLVGVLVDRSATMVHY